MDCRDELRRLGLLETCRTHLCATALLTILATCAAYLPSGGAAGGASRAPAPEENGLETSKVAEERGRAEIQNLLSPAALRDFPDLFAARREDRFATSGNPAGESVMRIPDSTSRSVPDVAEGRKLRAVKYGRLPLAFEVNHGQTDENVKYLSRGKGYTLFLTDNEAVLSLRRPSVGSMELDNTKDQGSRATDGPSLLRLTLVGANGDERVTGLDELPGKSNYFRGDDPKRWRTNVPNYAKVKYEEIYPGIDLVYYGNQQQLEYDFVVAPGADPRAIRFAIEAGNLPAGPGDSRIQNRKARIDGNGDLMIAAGGGEVRFHKPVVYQEEPEVRSQESAAKDEGSGTKDNLRSSIGNGQLLEGRYVLAANNEVRFEVSDYDKSLPLVIDPVLSYSTYLGGSADELPDRIAVDSSGNAYVTGYTTSADFPTASPLQPASFGNREAFVAKLNAAGNALVYSTYLGGTSDDAGYGIAVDDSGNVYLTGYTTSTDFPTASPLQPAFGGGNRDAFVAKLNAAGNGLMYSTYLGGSGDDEGGTMVADASGNAYVTGPTSSSDFPTANPLQPAFGGVADAFVAKLNAAGSAFVYSTYLGGSGDDYGDLMVVDASGNAYVTGYTSSADFPTASPVQPAFGGGPKDAFVSKVDTAGSTLAYSTYLGGSDDDFGRSIAVDASGSAYVTGQTSSLDFPIVSALQPAFGGGSADGFVTKLNAAGNAIVYSTYLGGSDEDFGDSIGVDASESACVTGGTYSTDFPTASPLQAASGGSQDAFVTRLNAAGDTFMFSTYLGGSAADRTVGMVLNAVGDIYIVGRTASNDFPTVGPLQASLAGGEDAFVAKIIPTLLGPSPYLSEADSPFYDSIQAGTTYLEDFEDGLLNAPGVVASAGAPYGPAGNADSVDGDDGNIDGFGTAGRSFFSTPGSAGITFTFDSGALGGYPTQAGIVWTDAGAFATVMFEAFDAFGASLGVLGPLPLADGSNAGETAEDRFFGAVHPAGISAIHISNSSGGIEVDHLQYGPATAVAPPTASVAPTSVDFPGNPLNLDCPTKPVTLTNTGTSDLEIISIVTSPMEFTNSTNCPASLAAGESCVIDIKFQPSVVGTLPGTLTIATDASNSPHLVALSGNGLPACQLLAKVKSATVLRGTEAQEFAIEDANPSCSPVEFDLTCSVENPAACALNPKVIPPSGVSTLRVSNLRAVRAESVQVRVTSTSEFRRATELVSVRFADFAFTRSPEVETVRAGETAEYSLAIRPVNGMAGEIALGCTGAPRGATCTVAPSTVRLDGATLAQAKVRVATSSRAMAGPWAGDPFLRQGRLRSPLQMNPLARHAVPLLLGLLGLLIVAASCARRDRRRHVAATELAGSSVMPLQVRARHAVPLRLALGAALLTILLWASCGGGGSMNFTSGGTPVGTYNLTISGTYTNSAGSSPSTLTNSTTVTMQVN